MLGQLGLQNFYSVFLRKLRQIVWLKEGLLSFFNFASAEPQISHFLTFREDLTASRINHTHLFDEMAFSPSLAIGRE